MTAPAGCGDSDLLSAYLDGEVGDAERRRIEAHLDGCPACGERLAGLRRVVGSLSRLERAAPPPALALEVAHRAARMRRRAGPLELLEDRLRALNSGPPLVVAFAVVLALSAILYLVAHGVQWRERAETQIVLLDPETSREVAAVLDDRDPWTRRAAGRLFERRGARWVEASLGVGSGVDAGTGVDAEIDASSAPGRELLGRLPELAALLADAEAVVLADRDRIVELRRDGA